MGDGIVRVVACRLGQSENTAACKRILKSVGKIRSHKDFWGVLKIADYENYSISPGSRIETEGLKFVGGLSCFAFTLPSDRGKIHVILGSVFRNAEVNEIFRQFQEQANTGELPFRRHPLKSHQCKPPNCASFCLFTNVRNPFNDQ